MDQLGEAAAVVLGGLPDPADAGKVLLVAAVGAAVIAAGPKAGAFIGTVAEAKEQLREQLGVALG